MKLAVVGNSVSVAPREKPIIRPYADLLRDLAPSWEVLQRSVDGGAITDLEGVVAQTLSQDRPDALVLQAGIVDCAPRPLAPWERKWLGRLHPQALQRLIIRKIHKHRAAIIRRRRLIQVTPLPRFRDTLDRILAACATGSCAVAVLPIFPAPPRALDRNPHMAAQIEAYNEALRQVPPRARFFEARELLGERPIDDFAVVPDSVHLSEAAHGLIAHRLAQWLGTILT